MSSVNGVGNPFSDPTATQAVSGSNSSVTTTVSKDEFLKLLVAQLKNQDPVNPVNNEQFITQLATFSSLEQLISINQAVTKLAGTTDQTNATSENSSSVQ